MTGYYEFSTILDVLIRIVVLAICIIALPYLFKNYEWERSSEMGIYDFIRIFYANGGSSVMAIQGTEGKNLNYLLTNSSEEALYGIENSYYAIRTLMISMLSISCIDCYYYSSFPSSLANFVFSMMLFLYSSSVAVMLIFMLSKNSNLLMCVRKFEKEFSKSKDKKNSLIDLMYSNFALTKTYYRFTEALDYATKTDSLILSNTLKICTYKSKLSRIFMITIVLSILNTLFGFLYIATDVLSYINRFM